MATTPARPAEGDRLLPDAPLIVTAHLDAASFTTLDALRRRHFPRELNRIPAHISLFHKLPGDEVPAVAATLEAVCRQTVAFDLEPVGLVPLGRGVAIGYAAHDLSVLRGALARQWSVWLTAQDRQGFRAHVTIQNKVVPEAARALLDALADGCRLPVCRVEGIDLWRYHGGPWEAVRTFPFAGSGGD